MSHLYNKPWTPPTTINQIPQKKTTPLSNTIKQINILNVNVRGAKSKLDSIESLLVAKSIDIADISETRLSEKEQLYLEGYHWYGQSHNKDGGGAGFFVSQRLVSLIEDTPNTCKGELKWINLRAKRNICIGIYYGPQENVDKTLLEEEYQRITDDINKRITTSY